MQTWVYHIISMSFWCQQVCITNVHLGQPSNLGISTYSRKKLLPKFRIFNELIYFKIQQIRSRSNFIHF